MGVIQKPSPVALIVAMLSQDPELFTAATHHLTTRHGQVLIISDLLDFSETDYYAPQMGSPLLRQFIAFARPIDPGDLAAIKHETNDLEAQLAASEPARRLAVTRPINLDPGCLEPSKLVLATTKNFSHRVYLGQAIYAEATLAYRSGRWQPWPYTYPDYASGRYFPFLTAVRNHLLSQLKET